MHKLSATVTSDVCAISGAAAAAGDVLRTEPGNVAALVARASAYARMGDASTAKRHLSEALRAEPDHADARRAFQRLKLLLKLTAQALTCP